MISRNRRAVLTLAALFSAGGFLGSAVLHRSVAASSATTHTVDIKSFQFEPTALKVSAGDTIVWENHDIVPHTATANDGSWDTGELKLGESATITVTADMHLTYFCVYHPMMKGSLIVER